MAESLPTELIQDILLYTDVETFFAARQTCRLWRHAASASFMLREALHWAPLSLPPRTDTLTNSEWNTYFTRTARSNLLGYRKHVHKTVSERELPQDCNRDTVTGTSHDGQKTIALKGAQATVYDHSSDETQQQPWEFPLASSLYPHWTSVCRALMDPGHRTSVSQRFAKHRIAVSSQGHLVAVALGRIIQIYCLHEDLTSPVEHVLGQSDVIFASPPTPEYEDTDGIVESLEFTDDDALLRVAISRESTVHRPTRVRYLGLPEHAPAVPSLKYWRDSINHVYLDSAALATTFTSQHESRCTLRGLRLLPTTNNKTSTSTGTRLFASSLQTNYADTYCIGLLSLPAPTSPPKIKILTLLPTLFFRPDTTHSPRTTAPTPPTPQKTYPPLYTCSKPTSSPETTSPLLPSSPHKPTPPTTTIYNLQTSLDRWSPENLPSATFTAPLLATSNDGMIMVIYEPDAGPHSCCIVDGGSVYICFVGDASRSASETRSGHSAVVNTEDDNISNPHPSQVESLLSEKAEFPPPAQDIPSWPFLLDRTTVDLEGVSVSREEGGEYIVTGVSAHKVLTWRILR